MTYSENDTQLHNLLAAVTDALLAEENDLDAIVRHYNVSPGQVQGVVRLIRRLHVVLVGVKPSRRFVRRLRGDLVGQPSLGLVNRVRYLPPRVQIVAGVALLAGFMILSRRRLMADSAEATPEIATAQ